MTIDIINNTQYIKAQQFKHLHHQDNVLILPNAWDALSAKIYELSHAKAIGTTSAGIAACLGFPDGEHIPKQLFFMIVKRIIESVNIPVTVDIESGMGMNIEEVCNNILHLIDLGAVGINIEDSRCGKLIPIIDQVNKIKAIKNCMNNSHIPLFINARIDTYWLLPPQEDYFNETLRRITAYQSAGADGIFIPGLNDLSLIKQFKKKCILPMNILSSPKNSLPELYNSGVSRLSIGSTALRGIATIIQDMAIDILEKGTSHYFEKAISYSNINEYFHLKTTPEV